MKNILNRNRIFIFSACVALCATMFGTSARAQIKSGSASSAQAIPVAARVTEAVDETKLFTLKGNVHALAKPQFDQGAVEDAMPVTRALLILQRSAEQEASLRQLLDDQQNKSSANFHAWLTPAQFGKQYGPADADIQTVTQWLTTHGFQNIKVGPGRTTIEFSGNVGQIREAFHTDIHKFLVKGEAHTANVSDPQIPEALAPVIGGINGLHDFRPKSLMHRMANFQKEKVKLAEGKPSVTFGSGCGATGTEPCYGVGPADFAKIYNVPTSTLTGAGVTIAIVQDSNLFVTDVSQFQTLFGLPTNFTINNIILNGPDPGVQGPTSASGDEGEADLDVEWAGAVAPGATIKLVVSEDSQTLGAAGIDLSALYIIDNNIAPILSESFGTCESTGTAGFYVPLWEQAAAQGITAIVSAGDSGSDTCDAGTADFASTGLSVSGIAATPFNVALGGTDFLNGTPPSTFWNAANATPPESAKSYIPESTWNSSCAATAVTGTLTTCTAAIVNGNAGSGIDLVAGSGGQSAVVARPTFQTGVTPTADSRRDLPDLSLFSAVNSSSNSFYLTCEADSPSQDGNACQLSGQGVEISPVGGTSAAAPAFAGIMALVIEKEGGVRQGNANYVLYKLFKQDKANASLVCPSNAASVTVSTCIFYDVVTGNNSVACEGSTLNCSNTSASANQFGVLVDPSATTSPAFNAIAGYDKATGLGSVNVANLVTAWGTVNFTPDTPAITASPTGTLAHGTNANFTVKVTATGTPTGDVSLIASPPGAAVVGIGPFTLSGGTVSISTNLLPGGTSYPVVAQYAGDGTFEPNTSAAVNVTVNKESSKSVISLWTFDPNSGAVTNSNATTAVYGSPYILRVDVTNSSSQQCSAVLVPCPTGNVSLTNNGAALNDFPVSNSTNPPSNTATLNSIGLLEDQPVQLPGGTDKLVATYAGDNSYTGSTSAADTVSITPGPTATGVVATPGSGVTTNTSVTLTATIATQSSGNGPTGNVTFTAGGATLGTAQVVGTAAANLSTAAGTAAFGTAVLPHTFATTGTYTVVATYASADGNYSGSASSGVNNATVVVAQGSSSANFTVAGSAATVTAGSSGNSTVTVTPSAGFTGAVAITCGTTLPGVSCTALNVTVPASGNGTGTLAINVAAPSTAMTAMNLSEPQKFLAAGLTGAPNGKSGWWMLSGGVGIAAMLLLLFTGRKQLRVALGLSLVCVLSFTLGCGGSSGGGGGGGGTTATVTHLTVSATKLKTTDTLTVSATVTGGTPAGNVQFFVDGAAAGTAAPVSGGTTGSIALTAASAPPLFQLIGTHTLSAHYLGDSTTGASASGSLNITVTGTTSLPITGTSGATASNGTVSLTIN